MNDSRILAGTLMELAQINNELKEEIYNEKLFRERAESGQKEMADAVDKFKKEMFRLQGTVDDWKKKYEALNKDLENHKTAIADLRLTITKLRKRKKK